MYDRCYRLRYSKGQVLMDKVGVTESDVGTEIELCECCDCF